MEEVILFRNRFGSERGVDWTLLIHEISPRLEGFAPDAIYSGVGLLIDIACRITATPHLLGGFVVCGARGPNKCVVGEIECFSELLELKRVAIDIGVDIFS